MKAGYTTVLLSAFLLAAPFPGRGQEGEALRAWLDRDTVSIGDPVTYYLSVRAPEGTKVVIGELAGELGEIEVRETGEGVGGRWHRMVSFEPGVHTLPAPEARLTLPDGREETLCASPLSFRVASVLSSAGKPQDIREIKPPRELPVSYLIPILIGAGALILLAAFVALLRFLRRPRAAAARPPPPRSAHEIAYEELRKIKDQDLPGRGLIEEFYVRVSNVVRHYLENRFALRSPERTTEEFLSEMASSETLSLKHQELVGDFLSHCDLVKFARFRPAPRQIENVYDSAVTLVDETTPPAAIPYPLSSTLHHSSSTPHPPSS
jgi:hypothetical protein